MALSRTQRQTVKSAKENYVITLERIGIFLQVKADFDEYRAIRRSSGTRHLNQAFDPRHVEFGAGDFWLLAENDAGEAIATYCLRRFAVDDFYELIRSLMLWFSKQPRTVDPRFVVECQIPSFGGEVAHGGGLWIRDDYRGCSRLALIMPRFARAVALRRRPFDHDSAMIRSDPGDRAHVAERKATFMGRKVYGFARVHCFCAGWFPPEKRNALMYLCHATRDEAIASLCYSHENRAKLRLAELGQRPLVDQHDKPVYSPAILGKRQEEARV